MSASERPNEIWLVWGLVYRIAKVYHICLRGQQWPRAPGGGQPRTMKIQSIVPVPLQAEHGPCETDILPYVQNSVVGLGWLWTGWLTEERVRWKAIEMAAFPLVVAPGSEGEVTLSSSCISHSVVQPWGYREKLPQASSPPFHLLDSSLQEVPCTHLLPGSQKARGLCMGLGVGGSCAHSPTLRQRKLKTVFALVREELVELHPTASGSCLSSRSPSEHLIPLLLSGRRPSEAKV